MSLIDRVYTWRNNRLRDPEFQDWAASFPLTRHIARRRARELFDLTAGFVYTQILYACVCLNVFETLADGSLCVKDLASRINLPEAGTHTLVRAAVSLGLLEEFTDERFGLGERGAALLGNPSVFEMIRHHALLYRDLSDPVDLLRDRSMSTEIAKFWDYSDNHNEQVDQSEHSRNSGAYSDLMAQTQAFITSEILNAYSFSKAQTLMDVGGGAGAFLIAVAKKNPDLKVVLCDLPAVCEIAVRRFRGVSLEGRAKAMECNFITHSLPREADHISLIRVLHDHDDAVAMKILHNIYAALPANGKIVIAEPMAKTRGAEPIGDAYFGLYLWAMGRGRPRSVAEISALLRKIGFQQIRQIRTRRPILTQILSARKI